MTKEKIARINELAHKAKAEGLTDAEKKEQAQLRREYIAAVTGDFRAQLENTYVLDGKGGKVKLAEWNSRHGKIRS